MKRWNKIGVCFLFLLFQLPLLAQEPAEKMRWHEKLEHWVKGNPWEYQGSLPTNHTKHLVSYNWRNVKDEYLSPIVHSGFGASYHWLRDEIQVPNTTFHIYHESLFSLGILENPANKSKFYLISGNYSVGPAWRVLNVKDVTLDLAPLASLDLQGHFKLSNTNNVGNLKASLGVDSWARVRYTIPWNLFPLTLSYSLQVPMAHFSFYPEFGQSYYDYISGENKKSPKLHFTSFHNSQKLKQRFLVDLPIRHLTVTLGAEYLFTNEVVNSTKYQDGYWSILVGISLDSFSVSGRKSRSSQIRSSYYD